MSLTVSAKGQVDVAAQYRDLHAKTGASAEEAAENYNVLALQHLSQQDQQQHFDTSGFMDDWRMGVLNDLGVDVDTTFTQAHKYKRAVDMIVFQLYTMKVNP